MADDTPQYDGNTTIYPDKSFGRTYLLFFTSSKNQKLLTVPDGLKVTFEVDAGSQSYPNTARIRVYNLSASTMSEAVSQAYDTVTLQAGYGKNPAVIFQGTVVQFKFGKVSNVDTFLEVLGIDGDQFHNYGYMNHSIENAASQLDKVQAIANGVQVAGATSAVPLASTTAALINATIPVGQSDQAQTYGGIIPRGVVLWGLCRLLLNETSKTVNGQWSVQQGTLQFTPVKGYPQSTAVIVNSQTGMIGIPQATEQGVEVTMLLNPLIQPGTLIQIDENSIVRTQNVGSIAPSLLQGGILNPNATVANGNGFYIVFAVSHRGDTRGDDWLTEVVCLAISQTNKIIGPTPVWSAQ